MTTDRHDSEATPRLQDEFWGEHTEWVPCEVPTERGGLASTIARWWDALLGAGAVAGREHGRAGAPAPTGDAPARRVEFAPGDDPIIGDASDDRGQWNQDGGWTDDVDAPVHPSSERDDAWSDDGARHDDGAWHDGAWTVEPEQRRSRHPGVDPLLARLGGLAVIVTLAAPLIVGFTGSGSEAQSADASLMTNSGAPSAETAPPTTTAGIEDSTVATTTRSAAPGGSASATVPSGPSSTSPAGDGDADSETAASDVAAPEAAALRTNLDATTPTVTTASCGARYELAAGDYWIRIADAAGVSLTELLEVNSASVDTVLVPGRSICLPVGAATPAPPAIVAPAPAPTAPVTTSAPRRPATTVAPAPPTTVAARPSAVPQSRAAEIIRSVWPDDIEERALEIAWRESNHRSNVNNWCCYGLFQIHWEAHRSWLSTIGVTSVSQLYDPTVNATAAYVLYQRSGGFGPWGG